MGKAIHPENVIGQICGGVAMGLGFALMEEVEPGKTVEAVYGEERIEGAILDDGTSLPADLLVLACGVRPRVEVARASGLPVNKGIVVNDTLGVPTITVPLANHDNNQHAENENLRLQNLWDGIEVYASLMRLRPAP